MFIAMWAYISMLRWNRVYCCSWRQSISSFQWKKMTRYVSFIWRIEMEKGNLNYGIDTWPHMSKDMPPNPRKDSYLSFPTLLLIHSFFLLYTLHLYVHMFNSLFFFPGHRHFLLPSCFLGTMLFCSYWDEL